MEDEKIGTCSIQRDIRNTKISVGKPEDSKRHWEPSTLDDNVIIYLKRNWV
jgi:hypothetical protein